MLMPWRAPVPLALLLPALAAHPAAGGPGTWTVETSQQFQAGMLEKVSVLVTGRVSLAPNFDKVFDSPEPYLWSLALDRAGNLYAGSGNDGKVFKIDKEGRSSLIFDAAELQVHALAVGPDGAVYAGTSPKGKIYRIHESGEAKPFFDPGEDYIWALLFDGSGHLFAGTGRNGKIYRVSPEGNGEIHLDTDETHVRSLAFRPDGKLLAGTDPGGLLIEVSGPGKGFVLYDSPVREIAALGCDTRGNIYAAGLDTKPAPGLPQAPVPVPVPGPAPDAPPAAPEEPGEGARSDEGAPPRPAPTAGPARDDAVRPGPRKGRAELYRISPDGVTRAIWKSSSDLILSLLVRPDGSVLLGTGDRGGLYAVEDEGRSRLLVKATQGQVTALARTDGGDVLAATSNLGKLFRLTRDHAREGSVTSEVKDAGLSSDWGRLGFRAEIPRGTSVKVLTRSGNTDKPDKTWSGWEEAAGDPEGGAIRSPRSRFLQWKAVLSTTDPAATPTLQSVTVWFLQRNAAPVVTAVALPAKDGAAAGRAGAPAVPGAPAPGGPAPGLPGGNAPRSSNPGSQAIQWTAEDPNGDALTYTLEYKGVGDRNWKLLKKDIKTTSHTLDTRALPDGTYVVRVTASDSPSNPKDRALTGERASDPFEVDNSPPEASEPKVALEKDRAVVTLELRDRMSPIKRLEVSLDAREWELLFPVDGICDSRSEEFSLTLEGLEPGEHSVVFRFWDDGDNQGSARAVFTVQGPAR